MFGPDGLLSATDEDLADDQPDAGEDDAQGGMECVDRHGGPLKERGTGDKVGRIPGPFETPGGVAGVSWRVVPSGTPSLSFVGTRGKKTPEKIESPEQSD